MPFADFKKQLSIGATADVLPDIVIIDSPDHASYAAMGIFADVTGKFDVSTFYEGPINSCTLDGVLYGIPFGSNCLALYYNEDMLAAAGCEVPATWDELKDVAAKCTGDNVYGLAFCSLQNEEGTFNFMPWVWSTGATSFEINSENAIPRPLPGQGSHRGWLHAQGSHQLDAGRRDEPVHQRQPWPMMINGPWQVPTMREQAPDLKWNVALIPADAQNASALGGENSAVIAGGNEEAAIEFLSYVTSPDLVASYIDEFGYIAARSDVAANQFEGDELMKKFVDQMAYAQPRGPHARWPEISDAISMAFNEVIIGTQTPEDAAAAAQAVIDGIIQ